MKRGINLVVLLLLSVVHTKAQTDTVFFDGNWKIVSTSDSAAFVRPPAVKLASGKYQVVDYYINSGQPQMVGECLDRELKVKDGYFIRYHKNGERQSEGTYVNGKEEGHWIGYYENGEKECEGVKHENNWNGAMVCYHENGNKSSEGTVVDGGKDGFWKWYAEDGNTLTFYATFKEGLYHGDVVRYHPNGTIARLDHYKNNKFRSGKCFTEAGLRTTWCPDRFYPAYKGGDEQYELFVTNDARYKKFKKDNRKLKGTVYIEAYFDETGKMYESKVVQSLHRDADKLALDLVRSMPDWLPALDESNRPIKSTRTLDIKF